ncbi:relaxase/mobilization nuclease-like protein [Pontibacter ummariensis]|uniref:Relaxase/Mobilisation nuclease domain-containing protein n=1 Tax=Pontibacter ummariensis TaxID=1610492 RepID=A0A239DVC5_9BACT|nr:relaxase/mobilization nuclease domain-containing protein [Pontibacter ummariensis]PRY13746.1 relaxase/mobilization nuclease-like protein [Pontibacter ummariensis]SNS36189.1 Relaxase/Mobilisation nuclease domain-containing protein [Pontibacter ummariensis]
MIVKILSSSGSFAGVNYNEDKVKKGTAVLLAEENFGMLQTGRSGIGDTDYKGYFQSWSTSEDHVQTVKHPQFHAVLSCEGREKDAQELKFIAEQYLEKMGYQENPYLIYFHSDTANNHVHIVSSRVNEEGRKIDDSFERTRSQKAIKEILLQDVGEEIKAHVSKAMGYSFSTPAQFKMLLEANGVKVGEKGSTYDFVKYGSLVSSMDKDTVGQKIAQYTAPDERIRQLHSLFTKYKPGLAPKAFQEFMKSKFGVEIVFHKAKGEQEPYGYSIIDHAQKQVLKGSQVMKLSELMTAVSRPERIASAQGIIGAVAKDTDITFSEFKSQLKAVGFSVNKRGEVKLKGEAEPSLQVDEMVMKGLYQKERLKQARSFAITSAADARILSQVFYLKPHSLAINGPVNEDAREYASGRLNSMLANGRQLPDVLESNGWSIAKLDNKHYLIDKREKAIYPVNELTSRQLDYSAAGVVSLDEARSRAATQQAAYSSGGVGDMLTMLAQLAQEGSREPQQDRKNKRRMKR